MSVLPNLPRNQQRVKGSTKTANQNSVNTKYWRDQSRPNWLLSDGWHGIVFDPLEQIQKISDSRNFSGVFGIVRCNITRLQISIETPTNLRCNSVSSAANQNSCCFLYPEASVASSIASHAQNKTLTSVRSRKSHRQSYRWGIVRHSEIFWC